MRNGGVGERSFTMEENRENHDIKASVCLSTHKNSAAGLDHTLRNFDLKANRVHY